MISVIVLSYNTRQITLKCLQSLSESKGIEFETIVIDNASTDGSAAAIAKQFPKVKLVVNKVNNGFAAGNNQGMAIARGDAILLLNSDCFVKPDTLAVGYSQLKSFDVVGCQLLNSDGSIQPSWGYFPTLSRIFLLMTFVDNFPLIRTSIKSIHVRDLSRYQTTQQVDWVTGAFSMLKKSVFTKVGGIDEEYFMYGEEMEWMYRITQTGFKVGYVAEAQATHLQGASTKSLARAISSEMLGYLYWFKKHNSAWQRPILKIILVLGSLYKTLIWFVVGRPARAHDNWETFKETLSHP